MPFIIFKDKVLLVFVSLSLFFILFSLGLVYFKADDLSSPVILRFGGFGGADVFGNSSDLWRIWLGGFIIVLLNAVLSEVFFFRERFVSYLLSGGGLFASILALVALITIISIN